MQVRVQIYLRETKWQDYGEFCNKLNLLKWEHHFSSNTAITSLIVSTAEIRAFVSCHFYSDYPLMISWCIHSEIIFHDADIVTAFYDNNLL